MVQGIASFMGGSTREQQLRQQSKEELLNNKTPIQKRREQRAGLRGGEGADSGIGKFATQLTLGALPGSGAGDVIGVFPDVEGGYEPSMLVNFQQAKRSFQEGNYKQAAAQGIFGAFQGLGGAADTTLLSAPFLGPAAPIAVKVGVGGKVISSVGKKLVKKALPKKEKIVYHTTDAKEGIQGEFKTGSDIGFHLGDTESISKNAAIKSEKDLKNLKTEKFKLNADDDEILTISRKGGRFQPDEFADQLLEAKAISEKERKLIDKKMDDFISEFGENTPEYYSAFNKFYKDLLGQKNIKAIKYFNEYDAGINPIFLDTMKKADIDPIQAFQIIAKGDKEKFKQLKDLDLSNTGLDVKPADSYVVFDDSAITKISEEKGIAALPTNNLDEIKNRNPKVDLDVFEEDKGITLSSIKVKEENQKQGFGSQALNDLVKYADENNKIIALSPDVSFGKMSKKELKDFYKKFDFVENKGQNKNFSFRETMIRNPKGIASLPTEQGATKVENMLKPKTEIRSEGGFKFAPEKIKQNVQLQKVRIAKMNEGKTPAGEPLNERIEIKAPEGSNLPNFVVGKIKPKDWQERTEKLLSDEEINRASKWYKEVYEYFNKIPGVENDAEAKNLAQAWFAGQQNASPSEALKNVLSIRQLLKEGKTPDEILNMEKIPYGGLEPANRAILAVLTDTEVKGVGQKISDFRDALDNKNVRSFMGDDVVGGQPFVVDIHTGRDTGLVDKTLLNFLEKKGYKIPKNIKTDFDAGVPPAKYENRSVFGNELTEYLNSVNWKGRSDWEPAEIQAIGWTGLTNFYGGVNTAGNIIDTLNINIQRISMEAKPGKGSPWDSMFGKDFSELSVEKQTQINNEVTEKAIEMVAKSENIDLSSTVFGTGGWQSLVNPSTIQQAMLTRDKAKRVAAKLGMLLNQDEVWVNSVKALTKNPENMAIDIIEEGSVNFKNSEYINKMFTDLFERTDGLIEGFQPIETLNNEVGIRIIITKEAMKNFGKKNKLNLKKVQDRIENLDINNLLKDYDFKMRYGIVESELDILSNNWRKNKDGTDYKKNYLPRGDDPRTSQDGKDFDLDRQELTDFFRQKIRDAQGVKTPNEEIVEIIEDPPPINKKAFGGFVESSNYDHYRII